MSTLHDNNFNEILHPQGVQNDGICSEDTVVVNNIYPQNDGICSEDTVVVNNIYPQNDQLCHPEVKPKDLIIKRLEKKIAFTLTEVLVALVIVGVIAGMVLPAVVNHFQSTALERAEQRMKQTLETSVKGLLVSENKNDTRQTMLYTPDANVSSYTDYSMAFMKKYLKLSRTCGSANVTTECFAPAYFEYDNNRKVSYTPSYSDKYKNACATLKNGAAICMKPGDPTSESIEALIDLNGRKGPNVKGRDLIEIKIFPEMMTSRKVMTEDVKDDSIVIEISDVCSPVQGTWTDDPCCYSHFSISECCDDTSAPWYNTTLCGTPPDPCFSGRPTPLCCENSAFYNASQANLDYCCANDFDFTLTHPGMCPLNGGNGEPEAPKVVNITLSRNIYAYPPPDETCVNNGGVDCALESYECHLDVSPSSGVTVPPNSYYLHVQWRPSKYYAYQNQYVSSMSGYAYCSEKIDYASGNGVFPSKAFRGNGGLWKYDLFYNGTLIHTVETGSDYDDTASGSGGGSMSFTEFSENSGVFTYTYNHTLEE